jgi:hypothetical protein
MKAFAARMCYDLNYCPHCMAEVPLQQDPGLWFRDHLSACKAFSEKPGKCETCGVAVRNTSMIKQFHDHIFHSNMHIHLKTSDIEVMVQEPDTCKATNECCLASSSAAKAAMQSARSINLVVSKAIVNVEMSISHGLETLIDKLQCSKDLDQTIHKFLLVRNRSNSTTSTSTPSILASELEGAKRQKMAHSTPTDIYQKQQDLVQILAGKGKDLVSNGVHWEFFHLLEGKGDLSLLRMSEIFKFVNERFAVKDLPKCVRSFVTFQVSNVSAFIRPSSFCPLMLCCHVLQHFDAVISTA